MRCCGRGTASRVGCSRLAQMTEVLEVLGSTYAAVFLAEIVGDKLVLSENCADSRLP